jgi:Ca2+-binding RTX toxin-like protein
MANNLNGHYSDQVEFYASNDSWTLGANGTIASTGYGFYGDSSYDNIDITVKGKIWAGGGGAVYSGGDNIDTVIAAGGQLSGQYAVYYYGNDGSVKNAGDILAYYGLYTTGQNTAMSNTGFIHANYYAVYMSYATDTFVNGKSGEVYSGEYGVYMSGGSSGDHSKTTNHGLISGDAYSFYASGADDKLINDGTMKGKIYTGSGNDTIDTLGGKITGTIETSSGDDTLITDRASHKLTESSGSGTDTVRSTVSYKLSDNVERLFLLGNKDTDGTGTSLADTLHGNSGDNELKGLAGGDDLWGHKGNDKIYGGIDMATDYFHFATGDGQDVIFNYFDGSDQIHLEDWAAITSLADLKNNHATNQGDDLLIHAGADTLLIKGIHKADLDAGDVYF